MFHYIRTGARALHNTNSFVAAIIFSLTFTATAVADEQRDWDAKYNDAMKACIVKPLKNRACVHVVDGNPMKVSPEWSQVRYKVGEIGIGFVMGEGARTISAGMVHFQGDDAPYWKRLNSKYNYDALKRWALYRANRDGMEDCQKACLATCISSRIIKYDDRNRITNWRDSVEREAGVCREFSAIAANIMKHLGLKARVLEGEVHAVSDGQVPELEGGHVMVQVQLPNGTFHMEPQNDSCEFYDNKFTKEKRHYEFEGLNLKERGTQGTQSLTQVN